jgi:hypothetical protein
VTDRTFTDVFLVSRHGTVNVPSVTIAYIQRVLWGKNRRSGGNRFGFFPTYTSAGNAFQQLQMLAEPQTEHVIQEKAIDEAEEDDDGEPEDEANLILQRRKIRNGDRSSRLVVFRGAQAGDAGGTKWRCGTGDAGDAGQTK